LKTRIKFEKKFYFPWVGFGWAGSQAVSQRPRPRLKKIKAQGLSQYLRLRKKNKSPKAKELKALSA
jgi:hypothetical protein